MAHHHGLGGEPRRLNYPQIFSSGSALLFPARMRRGQNPERNPKIYRCENEPQNPRPERQKSNLTANARGRLNLLQMWKIFS